MSDKFSVLMSVYYKENPKHFDLALQHILIKQTLLPDEFVLVCDGPLTKELDEVIDKYAHVALNVLKVYRLEKNSGLGNALNFGLSKCNYELIARADSDDICVAERFEKQVAYLKEHFDVAVVGSDIREFSENINDANTYKRMPKTYRDVYHMAKFRNPVNHMTVMFRKSAIEKVGSYQHLQYIEDYYLWVRLLAGGFKIENINEPLVFARIGNGMIQRRSSKSYISSWTTLGQYMLEYRMITRSQYIKNIIAVRAFIYMPINFKEIVYKKLLRK